MKTFFLAAGFISLSVIACKKSETKIETTENPDGSVTTTTIETEKATTVDTAKINATMDQAKEKLNKAGEKIDEAADHAGEKLKKAGEDLKDVAAKGAEKVEKGAEKVKEDLKKK
ncbi:hypothetical protein [Chryseobacterium koreense]|uniref:Uncharacterized protein n=1 Tax=Chryseobacterium koreense CCUG 49689 TaxID=1304281 RepID=A0A0J7IXD0_9FLAO|nr:hypothetical protein [Chryseobacterium koreense]KMQ70491.1 hypothetical protein ACM44_11895 [Chryseobacterium koreense CCUG 49689]MBB5332297.1 transcriptional regulator NrdR family protein [Chryseobacterium koreense]